MRIIEFGLRPDGDEAAVRSGDVDGAMSVYFSPSRASQSQLARFLAHVLFGAAPPEHRASRKHTAEHNLDLVRSELSPADPHDGPLIRPPIEGFVTVDVPQGRYRFRRYADQQSHAHLSIASLAGEPVDSSTFSDLLSGVRPSILADLYFIDFSRPLQLERVLSSEFARHYRDSLENSSPAHSLPNSLRRPSSSSGPPALEAMIARRDELARELQRGIGQRRQRGEQLAHQSAAQKRELNQRGEEIANLTADLERVEAKLASVSARLRFARTSQSLERERFDAATHGVDDRLAELDQQVDSCRRAIAALQGRDAELRHRLAAVRPAESGSLLPLADQRAHLQHVRRLVEELQGELATLARSLGSASCVCRDVHPRLEPTVLLLREECGTLERLTAEQEQLAEYRDLNSELEHLQRTRGDLDSQLEHLLHRRESLLRATRPRRQVLPQGEKYADEAHKYYTRDFDPADVDRLEADRLMLLENRRRLQEQIRQAEAAQTALQTQHRDVDRQRAELLGDDSLREIERELAELRARLEFGNANDPSPIEEHGPAAGRKASDFLAQLSGRRYVHLKLGTTASDTLVTDRSGDTHAWDSLESADHNLVYLSVALALAAHHAAAGTHMPLVVNEPTAGLDTEQAATVTSVLHRFASSGLQVILFTSDRAACERLHAAGAPLHEPFSGLPQEALQSDSPTARAETNGLVAAGSPLTNGQARTPVEAASADDQVESDSSADASQPTLFTLSASDDIGRFPAFGRDTASVFAAVGIDRVGDLADADPLTVAGRLGSDSISPAVVRLWQIHLDLMCYVPKVTIEDAQVLTGAGVTTPEDLAAASPQQLYDDIREYVSGPRGKRFAHSVKRYTRRRVRAWIDGAQEHEALWRDAVSCRHDAEITTAASDEAA